MTTTSPTTGAKPRVIELDGSSTLTVLAWRDRVIEEHPDSHRTDSTETLAWWTPVLGPTATLMAHRFAGYVAHGGQVSFTVPDLARTFGMGDSHARVRSALQRLDRFHVVNVHDHTVFVRLALPPLTRRHLDQLPPYLRELYEARCGR